MLQNEAKQRNILDYFSADTVENNVESYHIQQIKSSFHANVAPECQGVLNIT